MSVTSFKLSRYFFSEIMDALRSQVAASGQGEVACLIQDLFSLIGHKRLNFQSIRGKMRGRVNFGGSARK